MSADPYQTSRSLFRASQIGNGLPPTVLFRHVARTAAARNLRDQRRRRVQIHEAAATAQAQRQFSGWLAFGLLTLLLIAAWITPSAQAAPVIQSWQTDNGAKVLFVPANDLPMLDLRVVFDAGAARDGDRSGLASLTNAMLNEGVGSGDNALDADGIAETIAMTGAELSFSVRRDMASISLRSLTDTELLDPAVDLTARIIREPNFDAEAFERVRQTRLISLRRQEQDPGDVASRALYQAIFGTHPYANDPSGTQATVSALDTAALRDFHQRYYVGANATVAIVGDLDRDQAEALAERIIGGLPRGAAAEPLPPVPALDASSQALIDFPSSQTHLLAGQVGMRRGDPDYFPLYVGNHILGGSGLVSMLMDEVREKRGLSYSVYSYFLPMAQPGPMIMGLQTKNARADEAQEVMLGTLERFRTQGPTDKELQSAIKNITGGFPLDIASNAKILGYIAMIGFYDLPLDYLDRFNDNITGVTAEQIRDAYQRRVHPDKLAVIRVGRTSETAAEIPVDPEPSARNSSQLPDRLARPQSQVASGANPRG